MVVARCAGARQEAWNAWVSRPPARLMGERTRLLPLPALRSPNLPRRRVGVGGEVTMDGEF